MDEKNMVDDLVKMLDSGMAMGVGHVNVDCDAEGEEYEADLTRISGEVIQLHLPTHLEDISSTRIRENIDLGRDVSNLVDPTVQDLIYRNGLYLREPQYKQLVRASLLDFDRIASPGPALDLPPLRRGRGRVH